MHLCGRLRIDLVLVQALTMRGGNANLVPLGTWQLPFVECDLLHTQLVLLIGLAATITSEIRLEVAHSGTICTEFVFVEIQIGDAPVVLLAHGFPVVAHLGFVFLVRRIC